MRAKIDQQSKRMKADEFGFDELFTTPNHSDDELADGVRAPMSSVSPSPHAASPALAIPSPTHSAGGRKVPNFFVAPQSEENPPGTSLEYSLGQTAQAFLEEVEQVSPRFYAPG